MAVELGYINPGQWPNPGLEAEKQLVATGRIDWYMATRRAIVIKAAEQGLVKAKNGTKTPYRPAD